MSPPRKGGMSKTLDGKKAGLQNAKMLKAELETHKRKENESFSKVSILLYVIISFIFNFKLVVIIGNCNSNYLYESYLLFIIQVLFQKLQEK